MCCTFFELASKHIRSLSPDKPLSQAGSWTQVPSWTSLKAGPARPLSQWLLKTSTKQKLCHRSRRFNSFDQFFRGNVWMKFLFVSIDWILIEKKLFLRQFFHQWNNYCCRCSRNSDEPKIEWRGARTVTFGSVLSSCVTDDDVDDDDDDDDDRPYARDAKEA